MSVHCETHGAPAASPAEVCDSAHALSHGEPDCRAPRCVLPIHRSPQTPTCGCECACHWRRAPRWCGAPIDVDSVLAVNRAAGAGPGRVGPIVPCAATRPTSMVLATTRGPKSAQESTSGFTTSTTRSSSMARRSIRSMWLTSLNPFVQASTVQSAKPRPSSECGTQLDAEMQQQTPERAAEYQFFAEESQA